MGRCIPDRGKLKPMTPVRLFLSRMQRRPAASSSVPEPVVALLGPRGSGKSTALRALSTECGGTIVHARLDFAEQPNLDPISAVAFVAFSLMRGWTNLRRQPVFHRLGLSLLALNERLNPDRIIAQAQIKRLIRQYLQQQPLVRTGERVPDLLFNVTEAAATVGGIALSEAAPVSTITEQAKPAIGALLRGAVRWRLRNAIRFHHTIPEAEDASTVDSLIALSTTHRFNAVNYVMKALLADIEDFTRNHPPATARCDCVIPEDAQDGNHDHVWVLLLDNAQSAVGERFLQALIKARLEGFVVPPGAPPACDPLLVITAIDQWRPAWGKWWREPWKAETVSDRQPIPLFSEADRDQWVRHIRQAVRPNVDPARGWYPVWLDPVPSDDVISPRAELPWDQAGLEMLALRLTSGHPTAMIDIQTQVDALDPTIAGNGPAPATILNARDDAGVPLWERALQSCRPGLVPTQRPWSAVPPAAVVAARLSEQARRTDDLPVDKFPGATQTLRDLRANLWVSTFAARPSPLWRVGRGTEEHPAAMHPWLARCLLAGLAAEGAGAELWDGLFTALFDAEPDPNRTLFRDLAQGRFSAVVKELVSLYDSIDHRAWIRVLDDTTSAPSRFPHDEPFVASYRRLAPDHMPGRTPIETAVTSLTALLWLYRDPLAIPGVLYGTSVKVPWHKQIQADFGKLAYNSTRADVSALEEAASQFEFLT